MAGQIEGPGSLKVVFRAIAPFLAHAYLSLIGLTTRRTTVRGELHDGLIAANRRFIYACWHQRQIYFTYLHRGARACVLVSRSHDGALIAKLLELSRLGVARGSSSRGGSESLRELMEALREGFNIGITPDGPRGPAREVKEGAVFLAQKLGVPILPLTSAFSRRLVISRAWDRFHVPLPFGRVAVVYGNLLEVRPEDDLKAKAAELKGLLDAITDEAEVLVS